MIVEEWNNNFLLFFQRNKNALIIFVLAFIAGVGYYIRTRNLSLLIDATTGNYFPSDPDAIGILRYVQYIVEHGRLMDIDYLRFYPSGFGGTVGSLNEFSLLTHLIAYFYQFLHFFNDAVTVQYADVIYPAVAFVIALLFFFLLVQKIFDWKVALLASAFLTVIPAYLFRTMSGVSDKEAMAMIFFYLTLYLFLCFILEKRFIKQFILMLLAALVAGFLWLLWGGYVFVFLTLGTFVFLLVILERIDIRTLVFYAIFFEIPLQMVRLFYPERYRFLDLVVTPAIGVMFIPLVLGFTHYLIFTKDLLKIKSKLSGVPPFFVTIGVVVCLVIILFSAYAGPVALWDMVSSIFVDVLHPFAQTRWSLTVAENQQPYFSEIIAFFGRLFLFVGYAGAVYLFYEISKRFSYARLLTVVYAVFLLMLMASRLSPSSVLDGTTSLSLLFFFGGLFLFLITSGYIIFTMYRRNKEEYFQSVSQIPVRYLLVGVLLIYLLLAGRSANRLIFVFAPMTAIFAAYGIVAIVRYVQQRYENRVLHYGIGIASILLVIFLLNASFNSSLSQASAIGSFYNPSWQYAMDWVRETTPTDAVFAQWWDYGYYIETIGQRATLSDGGNAHPSINYFMARHVFVGQNETEALQLLAAKNATHLLISAYEIDKYGAFSSIGSDANYDRFSWIPRYTLDLSQSQETRNSTNFLYVGNTAMDEDFIYNGMVFPRAQAGIVAFLLPTVYDTNGTFVTFSQPTAYVSYLGQYTYVPVECVFYNGQKIVYEKKGLDGCLDVIPTVNGNTQTDVGALLYLSSRVQDTVFTRLYLHGEIWDHFTLVYSDQQVAPFMVYNGMLLGPIKIWNISYPDDLEIPEEYYGTYVPQEVSVVDKEISPY